MATDKKPIVLVVLSMVMLGVALVAVLTDLGENDPFPWGTHIVTIPVVLLVGVVIGWMMRDKQAAEERAEAGIESDDEDL
ncbi:hypothetical protein OAU50_02450 [Planctomycetota bacterium]|nr:hypothetical protein [Planctomycetota bacterium]